MTRRPFSKSLLARDEFYDTNCPQYPHNATLDTNYFNCVTDIDDLMFYYGCQTLPGVSAAPAQFDCTVNGSTTSSPSCFVSTDVAIHSACNTSVKVRVNQTAAQSLTNSSNLRQVLEIGFGLQWDASNTRCTECVRTSGACGSDSTNGSFLCYSGPTGNENRKWPSVNLFCFI